MALRQLPTLSVLASKDLQWEYLVELLGGTNVQQWKANRTPPGPASTCVCYKLTLHMKNTYYTEERLSLGRKPT